MSFFLPKKEVDMIIDYGSAAYFIPFLITALAVAALYFAFRGRTARTKRVVVLVLAALNIAQHLLKQFIYPHYESMAYPDLINTAYNMCATLILITPFVVLFGGRAFKQFVSYVGTAAGVLTMIVPHWYIGQTFFQWDVLRYYLCHGMLVATSLLPALWRLHRFNWRDFLKFPFLFFFMLIIIAFNDLIFWCLGVVGDYTDGKFFDMLYEANPCWMMHPDEGFGWLKDVIAVFTPDIFFGDAASGKPYVPVLWYAIPVTLLFWVLGFALGALLDGKRFIADMRAARARVCRIFSRGGVCPVAGVRIKYVRPEFDVGRKKRR